MTEVEPLPRGSPLLKMANCVITPHNAGGTVGASDKAMVFCMRNIARLQEGKKLLSSVLQYALDAPAEAAEVEEAISARL
eukprot:SAG22_NODE_395_length_11139_cov_14.562500_2_plen_80_part_00